MSKIEVIKEFFGDVNTPVAIATSVDNKPSVRFLSFKLYDGDKIYFMTGKSKNFCKELGKNPQIQICSLPNNKKEWLRMDAKVKFSDDKAVIQKCFDIFPLFTQLYKTIDNEEIALFYLDEVKARKQDLMGGSEEL